MPCLLVSPQMTVSRKNSLGLNVSFVLNLKMILTTVTFPVLHKPVYLLYIWNVVFPLLSFKPQTAESYQLKTTE